MGAVIPNAKITLTGEANGFVRTVTSNGEGFFSFPDLTPASFTISIEAPGFKIYKETGILINAAEQRSLERVKLAIGQASESVTVSAAAVSIDTSNGERAGTLSGEQLDEIALRGRDIFDAVSLMAGVVDTTDGRDAPSPTSIVGISILGGRDTDKNMTVDGVSNLDTGSNQTVHSMPSMDSVAEVKVLMSAYSAENGRNPTSINVITKGGGTSLHGQASYYFRNEDLTANSYFSNQAGRPRQLYRYNIGSYSVGGPVILPKLVSRKNNLFFFFSQEFQRQVVPFAVEEKTVPTALERQGDFSKSYNTNGSPIVINDPSNGKTAFPGNIIPSSRITPIGRAILNLFPMPNFVDPSLANRYNWNYYVAESGPYPRRTDTVRLDYSPKPNWQLYGTFGNNADRNTVPYNGGNGGWTAGSLNFQLTPIIYSIPGRLATLHSTNTITATLFNEAWVALSQDTLGTTPEYPDLVNRTKLGINIPMLNPSLNPLNLIPNMTFSGIQNYANPSLGNPSPLWWQNRILSFTDNVSKIHGTHTFKMGIYYEHATGVTNQFTSNHGSISFNTDGNNPLDSNNAYGNALLGNYDTYSEATAAPAGHYLFTNTEWYFQDTWKLRRNLTLDYGVRFYHDPPQYDEQGQLSSFSPAQWKPAAAPVLLRPASVNGKNVAIDPTSGTTYAYGLVGDFVPGIGNPANGQLTGSKATWATAPIAVGPRFGFAWDPSGNGNMAIRGGGGVYFNRLQGNPTMELLVNPPGVYSPTLYYGTYSDIATSASSGYLAPTGTIYSAASTPHQEQIYNYNFEIDKRIGANAFSIGYAGSLGRHQLWGRNVNAVPLGANFLNLNPQNKNPLSSSALPANFLRPYSAYGDVNLYEFANNSNYSGLLVSFQHRLSHGVTFSASYTFSKALGCASGDGGLIDAFVDPRSRNYGPLSFDRRHVFTSNFHYSVPKLGKATGLRPMGWVGDNWEVSGVVRMLTGQYLTPGYSLIVGLNSPTGSGSEGARPEVVNPSAPLASRFGPPPEPAGQATIANAPWSVDSTAPQLGNLGANTMRGPGVNNWDLSVYRQIPITERIKSQLRFETYNTFNHTQFSSVNTTLQFNTLGQQVNPQFLLPTANRPPRRVQIALRIIF